MIFMFLKMKEYFEYCYSKYGPSINPQQSNHKSKIDSRKPKKEIFSRQSH